jgi:hypothetical protein
MTVPPFTGSIDFKLAIGAFDVRVLRKARLTYAYMAGLVLLRRAVRHRVLWRFPA